MKRILIGFLSLILGASASIAADKPEIPKDYPLKNCPISGEVLGSGGMTPYKVTHQGTDVWLCCKMCLKKFNQAADKHVATVRAAAKK